MATGTPRNKTVLQKGFGLMDWVKLTTSATDLAGVRRLGGLRGYRMEEVAQHKSPHDAWAVFMGKVYNITPYLHYHPGGADILVKAAGRDCTALFNRYHAWVNLDGLAGKLVVGYLIEEEGASSTAPATAAPAASNDEEEEEGKGQQGAGGKEAPSSASPATASAARASGWASAAGGGGGTATSSSSSSTASGSSVSSGRQFAMAPPPPPPPRRVFVVGEVLMGKEGEDEEEEEFQDAMDQDQDEHT